MSSSWSRVRACSIWNVRWSAASGSWGSDASRSWPDDERADLTDLCDSLRRWSCARYPTGALGRFLDGAAHSTADQLLWLAAGDVPLPNLIEVASRHLADPDAAVVQVAHDLMNRDSMAHLRAGRSDEALHTLVIGPGRGARGTAPWSGSGSLVRRSVLGVLDELDVERPGSMTRARGAAGRGGPDLRIRAVAARAVGGAGLARRIPRRTSAASDRPTRRPDRSVRSRRSNRRAASGSAPPCRLRDSGTRTDPVPHTDGGARRERSSAGGFPWRRLPPRSP